MTLRHTKFTNFIQLKVPVKQLLYPKTQTLMDLSFIMIVNDRFHCFQQILIFCYFKILSILAVSF